MTVVIFILFWYLSYRFFYQSGEVNVLAMWNSMTSLLGLLFGLFLAGTMVSLLGVMVKEWWIAVVTFVLATFSFFIFYPPGLLSLAILLLLLIVLSLTFISIERERSVRIKISVYKILRRGFPVVLTMLSILLAVTYYLASAESIEEKGVQIPRQSFDSSTGILENYVAKAYIPGFTKDMSVSEASFQLLLNEIAKEGASWRDMSIATDLESTLVAEGIDINNDQAVMDAIQDNQVVREKALELYQETGTDDNILSSFGLDQMATNQPVIDAAYNALNDKINDLLQPYRNIVPIIFAVTFFLVLQFLNFFIKWIVYGTVWLIFIILKATKFVRVDKVEKLVEEINL